MFGFSFQKLLFTAIAIAAVWYGFKWIGRLQEQRDAALKARSRNTRSTASRAEASQDDDGIEEMVKCGVCGDYVSKSAAVNCGRDGCPYPG